MRWKAMSIRHMLHGRKVHCRRRCGNTPGQETPWSNTHGCKRRYNTIGQNKRPCGSRLGKRLEKGLKPEENEVVVKRSAEEK